ncbi:MAG TPA: glycosyltransferase family 1 protein [Corynebacteriales bacterium]|nr:glycosyltransferase family 1 protein [Mycobacteriales bacterium]
MRASGIVNVTSALPAALEGLKDLAYNLRWVWHADTQQLFRSINPSVWDAHHDPLKVLRDTTATRWNELQDDDKFRSDLEHEVAGLQDYMKTDAWFQSTHDPDKTGQADRDLLTAYFSMEFGITPCLPIYSGGLGVLAGDHLKSASDLGVPLIGVGLLYRYGYFRQSLSREGLQVEHYATHETDELPIKPVKDGEGNQLKVSIRFPGKRILHVAVWTAQVGRVTLLLLDTHLPENPKDLRVLTDRLYGGNEEHRIRQEIVLGIGGVRAVNAYCDLKGIKRPEIAHLNEGHAGLLAIERIRERMDAGLDFDAALAEVRAANIFTTHTPVPAGIDRFDISMVRHYLNPDENGNSKLVPGVPVDRVLQFGAEGDPNRFNMAHMGLRLSQRSNGVSKLHGVVSREMFSSLYPNYPVEEAPIGSVTNGVHMPTWISPTMRPLVKRIVGDQDLATADTWGHGDSVTDEELWKTRSILRKRLVKTAREAVRQSWLERGAAEAELGWTDRILDPNVLTVGFARRVSTYKRLTLMLQDADRLREILCNEERPVQFIIAGKAHPADGGGKHLLQELVQFADEAGVRDRIVFLPDYDIELAQVMIAGCDVWLNNPIRPQEASGTSGMKVVMNGGLTFSVSDGWWDEMADDSLGWTIPSVTNVDDATRDRLESLALYDLLEQSIAPLFYDRDVEELPRGWVDLMRRSLVELAPQVSATRMVRDYVDQYYRPALYTSLLMADDDNASANFVEWLAQVRREWFKVSITALTCNSHSALADEALVAECSTVDAGDRLEISAEVELGALDRTDVAVQVLYGPANDHGDIEDGQIATLTAGSGNAFHTELIVDAPGKLGVTARVVPHHDLIVNPAETGLCVWA